MSGHILRACLYLRSLVIAIRNIFPGQTARPRHPVWIHPAVGKLRVFQVRKVAFELLRKGPPPLVAPNDAPVLQIIRIPVLPLRIVKHPPHSGRLCRADSSERRSMAAAY